MSQKVEKAHNFLDPQPSPQQFELFEFGKNWKFDAPPLRKENISLAQLPKNHFKTHLFFGQLKHLKSTFTFGGKPEIWPPPLLLKKCTL